MGQNRKTPGTVLLPAGAGILLVVMLQLQWIHRIFGLNLLQLPLPSAVLSAILENPVKMAGDAWVTLAPALLGMSLGMLAGYGVALFVTMVPGKGYGSMILMTLINSVPIVALSPLMNRWFETDFFAKLAVIIVASSGAMAVNAYLGLNDTPKGLLDLMKISGASERDRMRKVLIPGSIPRVFTAVKTVIPAGMLAAIISEFFASGTRGLGYMIKYSLKVGNQKYVGWAYILAVSFISIGLYLLVCGIEKRVLKWHVSQKV